MRKNFLAMPAVAILALSLSACGATEGLGGKGEYNVEVNGQDVIDQGYEVKCDKDGKDFAVVVNLTEDNVDDTGVDQFIAMFENDKLTALTIQNEKTQYVTMETADTIKVNKDGKKYEFNGQIDSADSIANNMANEIFEETEAPQVNTVEATVTCP